MADFVLIALEGGGSVKIDAEDEELVRSLGPWHRTELLSDRRWKPAARNQIPVEGEPRQLATGRCVPPVPAWAWLHNLVKGVPDKHVAPGEEWEVYPLDGWWLNCRKDNLDIRRKR